MLPERVRELVLEALSERNDGWMKKLCRERLRKIKDPEVKKEVDLIMRREKGNDYRI